jgi:hypothetical protein
MIAPMRAAVLGLCLLLALWSGAAYLSPPESQPIDASATEFSAHRAMLHVKALSPGPRPVGSSGHVAARAYIMAEIARTGLVSEVQSTVSAFRFPGSEGFGAAAVQNVITRIKGTGSNGAILLNAHYDGGSTGPAAGDCATCVAALLETARALRAGPPLAHDVILVFSDAEEVGDHGAHAFATQHPLMRDVALAVNYESMGTNGPGSLYVTSQNNAALVAALATAMPQGFGTSVITELFNAIPNMRSACDLQDYLDYGVAGLGFVLHGQTQNYHTMLDDAAHLDPRSLQSFGDSALGLARAFDQLGPISIQANGDAVFFPLAPFGVIVYPAERSMQLAAAGVAIAAVLIAIAMLRGCLRLMPVLGAAVGLLAAPLFAAVVCTAIWAGLRVLNTSLQVFLIGGYATAWHVAGLSALAVAVTAFAFASLRRWCGAEALLAGAILALSALGLVFAIILPGMSYVATLPGLLALPSLGAIALGWRGALWQWAGLLPAMAITALVAPLVLPSGMLMAFAIRLEAMTALPLMALPTLLTALAAGFAMTVTDGFISEVKSPGRQSLAGVASLMGIASLGVGSAESRFDAQHPRPESVRYDLDADSATARWVTNDPRLGAWSAQFIPGQAARLANGTTSPGGPPTYAAEAPPYDLIAPEARLIEDVPTNEGRRLGLMITSPRHAPIIEVQVQAAAAIAKATIGGQVLDLSDYAPARDGNLIFVASAFAADGFALDLTLAKAAPVKISLADMSDGLPGPAMTRPPNSMPTPGATLDGTVVRRRFEF